MTNVPKKSICIFCGSRSGTQPEYGAAAREIGTRIANQGLRLVYGAGDVGLMGKVANAAQDAGGDILGVIPEHLVKWEVGKIDLTQYIVTENMHERKKVMFMNSDAIITLPGGPGSLDELFEVLTWAQLGQHEKPIYLLNVAGYWDPLITLIEHQIAHGFAAPSFREFLKDFNDVNTLFAQLEKDIAD
ncbi:TIGR00730 family Rossman fold protein [Amylibacter sp. SFDW26]|uniref:LOG family protein n=1 Tax=Amylibacter sp. SFDW26 TaxID=2652722 RepID=UPI00126184C2|nr:TIGR00730 family Rossman fold protein [Amylibacter sp. SFDW26]KAB7616245.1 TIGR00730 family Rossman fold protein [Amylibacter sp. SFDW26]